MSRRGLRQRTYGTPELQELARDVQESLDAILDIRIANTLEAYAEPMFLALPAEPRGIIALRVVEDANPAAAVGFTGAVEYEWVPEGTVAKGRVKITDIGGLSVSATKYRFTFLVVF